MPWYTIATIIAGVLVDVFVLAIVIVGARADRDTPREWL